MDTGLRIWIGLISGPSGGGALLDLVSLSLTPSPQLGPVDYYSAYLWMRTPEILTFDVESQFPVDCIPNSTFKAGLHKR